MKWLLVTVVLCDFLSAAAQDADGCTYSEIVERKRDAVTVQLLAKLKLSHLPNNSQSEIPSDLRQQITRIYEAMVEPDEESGIKQRDYTDSSDTTITSKQNLLFPDEVEQLSSNTVLYRWEASPGPIAVAAVHIPPELRVPNLKTYVIKDMTVIRERTEKLRKREADRVLGDHTIDITEHWRQWARQPGSNRGLLFCAGRCYDDMTPPITTGKPFVTVSIPTSPIQKRYAGVAPQKCGNFPKACCYKSHHLSFQELGLDHVILEPQHFNAGLCLGRCQEMWLEQFYHSLVMSHSDSERVCCSPATMDDLQVIYYDYTLHEIRFVTLPNMVVRECGCK